MNEIFRRTLNLLVFINIFYFWEVLLGIDAGACWQKRTEDGGTCKDLYMANITREECCVQRGGKGFSEKELSSAEYFFEMAIGNGATCASCLDSCDNAKCGKDKRCVLRNGKPKCICAPVCKKVPSIKQQQRRKKPKRNLLSLRSNVILVDSFRTGNLNANPAIVGDSVIVNENGDLISVRSSPWHNKSGIGTIETDRNTLKSGAIAKPVCGTDGRTYKTECQLKKRACRQNLAQLEVAYKGHCQSSCKFVNCSEGKYCLEDNNNVPHCVNCLRKCPLIRRKNSVSKSVCGVDGKSYSSICDLQQASCILGKSIPFAYKGPCTASATCDTTICKNRQICLEDYVTHKPRCLACRFKCPRKRHSKSRASNQLSEEHKICGTNNRTYSSWCQMMKDSCATGFFIDARYSGPCSQSKNPPKKLV